MTEENKLDYTAFNKKEQKLLNRLQREYKAKTLKELILTMAIELEPDICRHCYESLITGIKLCRNCGKAYVNEPEDIKTELKKLEENPVTEFYEPDVKRFSKVTKEGTVDTDVPKYLKEKREAIK